MSEDGDVMVSPGSKRGPPDTEYNSISKKKQYLEQYTAEHYYSKSAGIMSPSYKTTSPLLGKESGVWKSDPKAKDDLNSSGGEDVIQVNNQQNVDYSDAALRMMKGMGYETGKGLGKEAQGITEPVQASLQKGQRGLGHSIQGFKPDDAEWVERTISTDVKVRWMSKPTVPYDAEFFRSPQVSLLVGPRKDTIEDETKFVSEELLQGILEAKTVFDTLPSKELREARTKSNPFETIASVIFQNRAAMKMAEIDALSGFNFSHKNKNLDHAPLIYFCDICAGPGGFSEYVLWRTQWHAKGFGLTLKDAPDASDFKLNKFLMGPPECFEPYYGVGGPEGDGDILKPENLDEFQSYVLRQTGSEGVHFVMGDGGISVEGKENIQEILTKQLLLCQIACALSVLRKDGNFVCKAFDIFTPFTVGLVHLLRYAFDKVSIIKPLTSRPANSERYLLCMGCRKDAARQIYSYLFRLNMELRKLSDTDSDLLHVVPEAQYVTDSEFCRYVTHSNDVIGDNQLYNLLKLRAYVKNSSLRVTNQQEIREICLKKWEVPNEMRKRNLRESPMDTAERLLNSSLFEGAPSDLTQPVVNHLTSKHSWKCYLNYNDPILILGQGGKHVFYFDGSSHIPERAWKKHPEISLELPRDTIVEGQIVEMYEGESNGLRLYGVVLTDAIVLGGQHVHGKAYLDRQTLLDKLVTSTQKESVKGRQEVFSLKTMLNRLENFKQMCSSLRKSHFKGHGNAPQLAHSIRNKRLLVKGVTLVRHIKDPWNMELSSKLKKFYFFNNKTKSSQYEWPPEAAADFKFTRSTSITWRWGPELWGQIMQTQPVTDKLLEAFLSKVTHKPS